MRFASTLAAIIGFLALTGMAMAEDPAPASSTETYGDWTKRCSTVAGADGATAWQCEMVHSVRLRETGQTVIEIAIGRPDAVSPVVVIFQVPNTVWLRTPVTVSYSADEDADTELEASYFRCSAQACLAETELVAELSDELRSRADMIVSFEDGNRQAIRLPISLNGFDDAFAVTMQVTETTESQ